MKCRFLLIVIEQVVSESTHVACSHGQKKSSENPFFAESSEAVMPDEKSDISFKNCCLKPTKTKFYLIYHCLKQFSHK